MNKETQIEIKYHLFNMLYIDIINKGIIKYIMALSILYINFICTKKLSNEEIKKGIESRYEAIMKEYLFSYYRLQTKNVATEEVKDYLVQYKTKIKYEENENKIILIILNNFSKKGMTDIINVKIHELSNVLESFKAAQTGMWQGNFPYFDFRNELEKHELFNDFSDCLNKYTLNYGAILFSHETNKNNTLITFRSVVQKQIERLEYLKNALDLK